MKGQRLLSADGQERPDVEREFSLRFARAEVLVMYAMPVQRAVDSDGIGATVDNVVRHIGDYTVVWHERTEKRVTREIQLALTTNFFLQFAFLPCPFRRFARPSTSQIAWCTRGTARGT